MQIVSKKTPLRKWYKCHHLFSSRAAFLLNNFMLFSLDNSHLDRNQSFLSHDQAIDGKNLPSLIYYRFKAAYLIQPREIRYSHLHLRSAQKPKPPYSVKIVHKAQCDCKILREQQHMVAQQSRTYFSIVPCNRFVDRSADSFHIDCFGG